MSPRKIAERGPTRYAERIKQLESKLKQQDFLIDELRRSSGLETTVYNGFSALEKVLEPLRTLRPVREIEKSEGQAIEALRASLKSPQYELVEGHFGPIDPRGKDSRKAAR